MFSPSLEVVLHIAFREAVSRRHAHLTLEHLLYAVAHDPDGERILGACGVDLPGLRRALSTYLDESIERQRRESDRDPEQTTAFRRVLQTAILHVQSAQRSEATVGDILAAILQQPKSSAAQLLADQGVTAPRGAMCSTTFPTALRKCQRRAQARLCPLRAAAWRKKPDPEPPPIRCAPTA